MSSEKILDLIIKALEDLKAIDIKELDVRKLTSVTDFMVVCTGNSTRHVRSMANNLVEKAKENNITVFSIEGELDGQWVLVDLLDVVVHIMLQEQREFYCLEKLWGSPAETEIPKLPRTK